MTTTHILGSSCFAEANYDEHQSTLRIRFHNGWIYTYFALPRSVFEGLIAAASKGSFFHSSIRPHFSCRRDER